MKLTGCSLKARDILSPIIYILKSLKFKISKTNSVSLDPMSTPRPSTVVREMGSHAHPRGQQAVKPGPSELLGLRQSSSPNKRAMIGRQKQHMSISHDQSCVWLNRKVHVERDS